MMDAFVTRKKRKSGSPPAAALGDGDEPTDVKLALLASRHPKIDQETLLDILLAHDGLVSEVSLSLRNQSPVKKQSGVVGLQSSLRLFATDKAPDEKPPSPKKPRLLSKKGKTLFLFDAADIAEHTPCTIVHNFLPPDLANELLKELLEESKTFEKITFKLFDNVVSSPHTSSFYVDSLKERDEQKLDYLYNGARLTVGVPADPATRVQPAADQLPRTSAKSPPTSKRSSPWSRRP